MHQTFKTFLESKELTVDQVRPLEALERKRAEQLARIFIHAHELLDLKNNLTVEHVGELRDYLKTHGRGFEFVDDLIRELDDVLKAHARMITAGKRLGDHAPALRNHASELKAALLSGNLDAMRKHRAELSKRIDDVDHHVDAPATVRRRLARTFTETPSIFGTTRLLANIGGTELAKVKSLDFSKTLYTAIDFPHGRTDTLDHALYFLLQLDESPKPRRMMEPSDLRTQTKVRYANDRGFEELLKLVDRYLHANDKELVPRMLELIERNPTIKAANDKAKKQITTVYRGLGFGEDSPDHDEIIERERQNRFVATSTTRHAAKKFALQIGHLEHDDDRRSQNGVIITYSVTPKAILLDTAVLETAYNEREVLIDARLAKVESITDV